MVYSMFVSYLSPMGDKKDTLTGEKMKVSLRIKVLSNGHRSLFLDIYHQGTRKKEFLGLRLDGNKDADQEKMRMAEMVRAKRELELFADEHNLVTAHRSRVPLRDFVEEHLRKMPTSALKRAAPRIEAFFGPAHISGISSNKLEDFQRELRKDLKDSTVETYINALSVVFNRAMKENLITSNPVKGMERVRAQESVIKSLTEEELQRLIDTQIQGQRIYQRADRTGIYGGKGAVLKKMFLFACFTGLRWSDVRSLTWSRVRGRQVERVQGKTDGVVYIPLNDRAWEILEEYTEKAHLSEDPVFPWGEAKTNPDPYLAKWGEDANLPFRLGFHVARHTFARRLLETGSDIVTVQNLMGHRKIENTARYGRASNRQKIEAVKRLVAPVGE